MSHLIEALSDVDRVQGRPPVPALDREVEGGSTGVFTIQTLGREKHRKSLQNLSTMNREREREMASGAVQSPAANAALCSAKSESVKEETYLSARVPSFPMDC